MHLIQIIGEAGRQVSREFSDHHAEIPWADIIGMRHKVVHDDPLPPNTGVVSRAAY